MFLDFCFENIPLAVANVIGETQDDNGAMSYSALEIWERLIPLDPRTFCVKLIAPHTGITSASGTIYVAGYWRFVNEALM